MERIEPSKELRQSILRTITAEERRRARNYLLASLATASLSTLGVVFSVTYAVKAVYQSSVYQYFSLLFSDADIALSYWREFVLSLVESLPFFAITLVLVATFGLMLSLRMYANSTRPRFTLSFSN